MIIYPYDENYPAYVCGECGLKASKDIGNSPLAFQLSTLHTGICDVCGKEKKVTEPRDFFYPDFYIDNRKDL